MTSGQMKVMAIVGTRPEIIKLSRVLAALEAHTDLCLVHSGQNYDYELNQIFFEELEIRKPDHFLGAVGATAAETIGLVIARADEVMAAEKPDAVLFYGDTNTCLAVSAAKRRHIPVFHMEAGNRCFDDRVPEEVNRRLVDHLSDINMPLTEHARRYLLAEGVRPETVFTTGSPMKEVLAHYAQRIDSSAILTRLGLTPRDYLLVSAHREENVDRAEQLDTLVDCLGALAKQHSCPVVVSTHPRTLARLREQEGWASRSADPGVRFCKPFGFFDYVHLEKHAKCVVSDSGTLTEEASLLGFPAVMIRDAHERPEGMDAGVLVATGIRPDRLLHAVSTVIEQWQADSRPRLVPDYDTQDVSRKVLRLILSYVPYVNRTVYFELDA